VTNGAGPGASDEVEEEVRRYAEELSQFERDYFRRLRRKVGDNISAMARISGISRFTLYRKLGQIGLDGGKLPEGEEEGE
jgi:DNA-binding NtrC family response regulator